MLEPFREARALKAVLGPAARVRSRRELQRRRSRRSVAVELADGSRFVVKYDWRAERVAQEASRLATANRLEGIDTPRLRGATRHHLVQDFVAGEGLDALARQSAGEARAELFARAARVLAEIHGSRSAETAALKLPGALRARTPRGPGAPRLARDRGARLSALGGAAGKRAARLAPGCRRRRARPAGLRSRRRRRRLGARARRLPAAPSDPVFRGRALRGGLDRDVAGDSLGRARPPAALARAGEREAVTATYLEAAQQRGLLREVSAARSASLATSGLLYDHLIVAKQMVRKLRRACRPSHLNAFRTSLDALAEGAG